MVDRPCMEAYMKALDYLNTKTAAWPTERLHALYRHPTFRAYQTAIDAAILAGDLRQTQTVCRQWWQYMLNPSQEHAA